MVELSNEPNSDEIPVNVVSKNEEENNSSTMESKSLEPHIDELTTELELEKQRSSELEEKLKLVLADFQNLSRKTQTDIENGVNSKINEFALDFLQIYDDWNCETNKLYMNETQYNGKQMGPISASFNGKNKNALETIVKVLDKVDELEQWGVVELDPRKSFKKDDIMIYQRVNKAGFDA